MCSSLKELHTALCTGVGWGDNNKIIIIIKY